jgi:hypothetical protein
VSFPPCRAACSSRRSGAGFPIFVRRRTAGSKFMEYAFFFAKYFGSGVIVATAFIHVSFN